MSGFLLTIDGQTYRYRTLSRTMRAIAAHRLANHGDLTPDWDQRVLAEIRTHYPDAVAEEEVVVSDVGAKYLGVASFLKAAVAHLANGSKLVERELALQRAGICQNCPKATNLSACGICKRMVADLMFPVPDSVDYGERAFCGVCHCSLAHKVWLPAEVILTDDRQLEFPDHCWVRTTMDAESHTGP